MSDEHWSFDCKDHYAYLKNFIAARMTRNQMGVLLSATRVSRSERDVMEALEAKGAIAEDDVALFRNAFLGENFDYALQYAVCSYQARRLGVSGAPLQAAVWSLQTAGAHAIVSDKDWDPRIVYRPSSDADSPKPMAPAVRATARCLHCEDGAIQVALIPCGHYCLCKLCARIVFTKKCPICSTRSSGVLRIRETAAVYPGAATAATAAARPPSPPPPPLPTFAPPPPPPYEAAGVPRELSEEEERAAGRMPLR